MLDFIIERMNENSKCFYEQNNAYGYSQLALAMPNSGGCINTLSIGNTKAELYYQVAFLLDWLNYEKDLTNHRKYCTHRDTFNRFGGKKDISVAHVYKDKIYCSGCRKTITENEFDKSKVRVTFNQVRNI